MNKEMIPITCEENKSCKKQKVYCICKKEFNIDKNDKNDFKIYHKVRNCFNYTTKYKGAAHNVCNLRDKIPKEIIVVFHNGCTYDYRFISELAKKV